MDVPDEDVAISGGECEVVLIGPGDGLVFAAGFECTAQFCVRAA